MTDVSAWIEFDTLLEVYVKSEEGNNNDKRIYIGATELDCKKWFDNHNLSLLNRKYANAIQTYMANKSGKGQISHNKLEIVRTNL